MSEPLVFHFQPGPSGAPEVLYMLDLDCRCSLCKHEQIQRFYHCTPFHRLTVVGLDEVADRGPLKAGYRCENCGEAVGSADVRRAAVTYGFADDAGVIRIFDDLHSGMRRVELTPRRRLDPQAMPRWTPDSGEERHVSDDLVEETVEQVLDRPFCPKLAWRDLLMESARSSESIKRRITPHLDVAVAPTEAAACALIEEAKPSTSRAVISLADSVPSALPTHRTPARLAGRWPTWLPDDIVDALKRGDLWALASISPAVAIASVERTLELGGLRAQRRDDDGDTVFFEITTPSDVSYDRVLAVSSIVRRAVYTGLTPGEAARLTCEEIVAHLLDVW